MTRKRQVTGIIETYRGNDALALAADIESALTQRSTGDPRRVLAELTFCEGELALIMKALRAPRVVRKN